MSDKPITTISSQQEIPCMLLPMVEHTLLVPTTTVAEMSAMQPLEAVENAPEWLLGLYEWRGTKIPVVAIETINGGGQPQLNTSGRIAVLNNSGVSEDLPFIAILTQGIPRMARVADEDIVENEDASRRAFDIMAVKVGMEEFYIPDVTALEMAYLNFHQNR